MLDTPNVYSWEPPRPSSAARKIPKKSEGHFVVTLTYGEEKDGTGQVLHCESLLEYRTAICLLYRPDFATLREQVGPVLWVRADGLRASHYLDLVFTDQRGRRTAIVVKPSHRALREGFQRDLRALQQAVVPRFADEMVVVTERNICRTELANAELMHAARFADEEADVAMTAQIRRLTGSAPARWLVDRCQLNGKGWFALVRAARDGRLLWNRAERLTLGTVVQANRAEEL